MPLFRLYEVLPTPEPEPSSPLRLTVWVVFCQPEWLFACRPRALVMGTRVSMLTVQVPADPAIALALPALSIARYL